jgi:signal transduction histidine kinase
MEKAKSDFIVLAGHELRTPLTLICGYSRLLISACEKNHLSPDVQYMLGQVSGAAGRLSSVVDDIINVALIDADQLQLSFDPLDLGKLTHSVIEQFKPVIQRLEVASMEGLPPIQGDARYLRRAVGNVIGNAIKYTPDGGLIEVWCQKVRDPLQSEIPFGRGAVSAPTREWLDLIVRDSGIGIDRDEQERIFDKFYVLENTDLHSTSPTGYKGGGLGLGLSVVRGIVAAHGGRVFVESGQRSPSAAGPLQGVADPLQGVADPLKGGKKGGDESALPGSTFHMILPLDFNPHQLQTRKT